MIVDVLKACQHLTENMPAYESSYIRGKLGLNDEKVYDGITCLINSKDKKSVSNIRVYGPFTAITMRYIKRKISAQ